MCQAIDNMSQLADVMRAIEQADDPAQAKDPQHRDIHTLCEYALQLLTSLSDTATALDLSEQAQELENLYLPIVVWDARHGGEIRQIHPVVNAIAYFANHSAEPEFMVQLYDLATEVFNAVSLRVLEEIPASNPEHPGRLLILNRAISATRSLQAARMEPAFESVVEWLPDGALAFFAEGMEQMDSLEYPQPMRDLLSRYYKQLSTPRILH